MGALDMLDRFLSKVKVDEKSGCWLWQAAKNADGYGHFGVASSTPRKAHRVSYALFVGEIPAGMQVCHSCDTPSCVNPAHLFVGTAQDNMDDRGSKGRTAVGVRNGKSRITPEIAGYIRVSPLSERSLAAELGVHRGTVNAVRSGRTWKEVSP